jgi:sarcosine oxidase subunit beta
VVLVEQGTPGKPTTPPTLHRGRRLAELWPKAYLALIIGSWAGIIENTPDGRPEIDRRDAQANVVVATPSSVGFGLSPARGHAIRDLVIDGACSFADISTMPRPFAQLEPNQRDLHATAAAEVLRLDSGGSFWVEAALHTASDGILQDAIAIIEMNGSASTRR